MEVSYVRKSRINIAVDDYFGARTQCSFAQVVNEGATRSDHVFR